MYRLFEHRLHCHRLFDEDKKYLRNLYELRCEDYVQDPARYHQEIATLLAQPFRKRRRLMSSG